MMPAPPNSKSLFYNYKGYFSIVLMALVDVGYQFIFIDVGNYGCNGDSGIFKHSLLGEVFAGRMLNIPPPKRLPGYPDGAALPTVLLLMRHFPLGWIS